MIKLMAAGELLEIGRAVHCLVEAPITAGIVNVITLSQSTGETIVLRMAQVMWKFGDAMKILAQVNKLPLGNLRKSFIETIYTMYIQICPIFCFHFFHKVNGGWSEYGDWEKCPHSCGGLSHSRYRECNNPVPQHGGDACTLDGSTNVETKKCNNNPCPGE